MTPFDDVVDVDVRNTQFSNYNRYDWVMLWIEIHGGAESGKSKDWLLNQITEIMNGVQVIVRVRKTEKKSEYLFFLDNDNSEFCQWQKAIRNNN